MSPVEESVRSSVRNHIRSHYAGSEWIESDNVYIVDYKTIVYLEIGEASVPDKLLIVTCGIDRY